MPADFRLDDRVIVVTGASRGIGEAVARACAAAGAAVVVSSRKPDPVNAVAESIRSEGGVAIGIPCHVGREDDVKAMFQRATDELGQVTGLVNNAVTNPYFGPMLAVDDGAFDKTFEVNVKGPLYTTRAFASQTSAGSVVNISSVQAVQAAPLQGVYAMTKASILSMTRTLAAELGPGIRVNAIAPGLVETYFASALVSDSSLRSIFTDRSPLARHAQPDEIAGAAIYLLSDASSFATGSLLTVDGGMTAT